MGRFMNVFAAPGDAFDDIKTRPISHANWAIPLALVCLASIVHVIVMFSQPAIVQQVLDQQEATFQKQVDAGKMTEEQKDKTIERVQQFMKPSVLTIMGSCGAVLASTVILFGISFGLWLLGRWVFTPPFAYLKALEVAGLASLITALGTLVSMLLTVITGKMGASLSPALLVSDFDPTNKTHACLGALNAFSIWYFAVLSIGLSRISNRSFIKAASWVFLIWAILKLGVILVMPGGN